MHLVLIYYFAATNQSEALREKLRVLGVHPQKYLYTFNNSNNSVYIKLMIPWVHQAARRTIKQNTKWCYIGSTSVGALSREHNRRAKVKQCQAGQYVQVEPAIRVWAKSTLPYTSFSTLVVQRFDNYRDAWIQEHILIDSWQARLNFPFIYKFFKKTAFGPQRISSRIIRPTHIRSLDFLPKFEDDLVLSIYAHKLLLERKLPFNCYTIWPSWMHHLFRLQLKSDLRR